MLQDQSVSRGVGRRVAATPIATIRELVNDIGPRPATSKAEAQAAAVLAGLFRRSGLEVTIQPFPAAAAPVVGLLLLIGVGLLSALSGWWLPIPGALLAGWAALFAWREVRGPPVLATLLRQRESQNVVGTRAAGSEPRWRVVLLCHLDTPRVLGVLQTRLLRHGLWLIPLALSLLALLYMSSTWWAPARTLALGPAAVLLLAAPLLLWREYRARWAPGAVSAAGAALAAASIAELPDLRYVELWVIATGAGAAGGAGTAQVLSRYPFPADTTCFINLPALGMGQLSLITLEGPLRRVRSDRFLRELLLESAAQQSIDLALQPALGERLESTAALARGYHAVSLAGLTPSGLLAGYRAEGSQGEALSIAQLELAQRLLTSVIRRLEAIAAS